MSNVNIKEIEDIISVLSEEKNKLKISFGEIKGIKEYHKIFLKNSLWSEEDIAKSIYKVIKYTLSYGAEGEDVTRLFIKEKPEDRIEVEMQKKIIKTTQYAILRLLPDSPKEFALKIIQNYRKELMNLNNKTDKIEIKSLTINEQALIIHKDIPYAIKIAKETGQESVVLFKIANKIKSFLSMGNVLSGLQEIKTKISPIKMN